MKKAALIIILVIAGAYLIGNSDTIASFASTVAQGAIIPLVIAIIVMLLRYLTQAFSYKASFEAVGFKRTTLWSNTVLIYSLVFINTFCMFGGATGVAFIVDDAHRKGADLAPPPPVPSFPRSASSPPFWLSLSSVSWPCLLAVR